MACGQNNIPLSKIRCHGWNVVHCCAYFGRSEIFLWLQSLDNIDRLLAESCARSPNDGAFSPQIAIQRGYTFLAELLLASGCPLHDCISNNSVYFHAKKSELEFVQEWGKTNEKPLLLANGIEGVIQLMRVAKEPRVEIIKTRIVVSNCLSTDRWIDCEYKAFGPGPLGMTYFEVLDKFLQVGDSDFTLWLCRRLVGFSALDFSKNAYGTATFWGESLKLDQSEMLDLAALKKFAEERNDENLRRHLSSPWNGRLQCSLPEEKHPARRVLMRYFQENLSVSASLNQVYDEVLYLDVLNEERLTSLQELETLFARGAQPKNIADAIDDVTGAITDYSRCEWSNCDLVQSM